MTRRDVGRQRPPGDLADFPSRHLTTRRRWARCHRRANGVWFRSSGGGRWDLPEPEGTCYLADDDRAALTEVVGPDLYDQGFVTEGFLRQRVLTTVTLRERPVVADLLDAEVSRFGVTAELSGAIDYARTQAWARAFRTHGLDGIVYGLRFRPNSEGLASFGPAGADPDAPVHGPPREALDVAEDLDLSILYTHQVGRLADFTVADPPT
jgi:hypothetical protein